MGINFDEMKNKAKDALGQHGDKADQGVDKAGDFAKSKFGEEHADKIDSATGKAKDYLGNQGGQGGEPGQGGPEQG